MLSIALSCGVARAATPEESIERGVRMMQSGQFEAAMREFLDADARAPSAHAGAEIGLAERALGRWADAELHLTEALASVDDAWIQ
ncbi:MAG TPA: hypothetical protein VHU90_05320, partial [Galbitalea sp.]|nr:hypothetical protein [Galbitalea sp.]